eukprot:XP_001708490.1 Hypothetical protein GL50803_91122 [Giardia lamblia ATCC 50803]
MAANDFAELMVGGSVICVNDILMGERAYPGLATFLVKRKVRVAEIGCHKVSISAVDNNVLLAEVMERLLTPRARGHEDLRKAPGPLRRQSRGNSNEQGNH